MGTIRVKPGETFTVNAPYKTYTQSCLWLWGGEVRPDSEIYGTTNTVTFRATAVTPVTMPCKVQCTTYYHQSGSTSSGINKEIVYWNVFVENVAPTSISVYPSSIDIKEGNGRQLSYELYPSDAVTSVEWSSGDYSIASVSASGYVSGRSPGETYVYATTKEGLTAKCLVSVSSNAPHSISLRSEAEIIEGETLTLRPSFSPAGTSSTVYWLSDNSSVAEVNGYGTVTGRSPGDTYITATTENDLTARCHIIVKSNKPESISMPEKVTLLEGESQTIKATLLPAGTKSDLTWESSDNKVATVSQSGIVTAKNKGRCTVTVRTANGIQARCEIAVVGEPQAVSFDNKEVDIKAGYGVKLNPVLAPADSKCTYTWESSDRSVATVSNGFVTGVSAGETTVKCHTSNGLVATVRIIVSEPTPENASALVKSKFQKADKMMSRIKTLLK
ncbi:MAG: Ig-like domain-containing protein [Muribaculaceae bacterium]|nr:Ig-like domain-containing protein [Muribaculaceae bacterium]